MNLFDILMELSTFRAYKQSPRTGGNYLSAVHMSGQFLDNDAIWVLLGLSASCTVFSRNDENMNALSRGSYLDKKADDVIKKKI